MSKKIFQECIPPILWRMGKKFKSKWHEVFGKHEDSRYGDEKQAAFYDAHFLQNSNQRVSYIFSLYYPVWTVIVDRICRAKIASVLEIGCGSGQLATFLRDSGLTRYRGIDFSSARIAWARNICPEFEFFENDVFQDMSLESYDYECVLITEFLEHIENDIAVLERIRKNTIVFATIPNFPNRSHVRYFRSRDEVMSRYAPYFSELTIDALRAVDEEKVFYLVQGIR